MTERSPSLGTWTTSSRTPKRGGNRPGVVQIVARVIRRALDAERHSDEVADDFPGQHGHARAVQPARHRHVQRPAGNTFCERPKRRFEARTDPRRVLRKIDGPDGLGLGEGQSGVLLQHERAARGGNPRDMTGWDRPDPAGPVSPTTQVDEVVRHIDLATGDCEEQLVDAERIPRQQMVVASSALEVQPKMTAQRGENLGRSGDIELTSGNPIVSPQDEIGDRHRGNSHAATRFSVSTSSARSSIASLAVRLMRKCPWW